jgi:hypothetical protein
MMMEWSKDPKAVIPMLIISPVMGLLIAVAGSIMAII